MSVSITSASPTTFGPAGGAITVTGSFPSADTPFDVLLQNVDTTEQFYCATDVASGDEVTLLGTAPADIPPGTYDLIVFGVTFDIYDAWGTQITVTGAVDAVVTGVSPASLSVEGGTVTITGTFELGVDYYAELRLGAEVAATLTGPVQSEDGATLVFDLPSAPEGDFQLYVFFLVDDVLPEDLPSSQAFTVTGLTRPVVASARSASGLKEAFGAFVPPEYCGIEPLAAGLGAALALAEAGGDSLREQATLELGAGTWLTLAARGQGILRATGEPDATLRLRMRSVDDQLTRPVLEEMVNAIIFPDVCEILEWFDHSYLDVELEREGGLWLDSERLSGGPSSFIILVPQRGWLSAGTFLDADLWLDTSFLGTESESGAYAAIINAINRAKAAGVFWRLCLTA